MKIYLGDIREYTTGYLASLVDGKRVERSMKYRFEADIKRSLMAHVLLNLAVKEECPDISLPVMTSEDENGRPLLDHIPGLDKFRFSLSHSGDYAVCAVNGAPVGVDIEVIGKDGDKIARRFFAEDELKYIYNAESFCHIWTLKESFMKAVGLGMKLPMDAFSVADYDENTGICRYISTGDISSCTDAAVRDSLIPYLNRQTGEFSITGKCVTFENDYSLAVASSLLMPDDIRIINYSVSATQASSV